MTSDFIPLTCFVLLTFLSSALCASKFRGFMSVADPKLNTASSQFISPHGSSDQAIDSQQLITRDQYFHGEPFKFRSYISSAAATRGGGQVSSFSASFIFSIDPAPANSNVLKQSISFVISSSPNTFQQNLSNFNIFSIKFWEDISHDYQEIHTHMSISFNNQILAGCSPVGYLTQQKQGGGDEFIKIKLVTGELIQVMVEHDGIHQELNIAIYPLAAGKPIQPLLSLKRDLSPFLREDMYVGVSAANANPSSHQELRLRGFSFLMGRKTAREFWVSESVKTTDPLLPADSSIIGFPDIINSMFQSCDCFAEIFLNLSDVWKTIGINKTYPMEQLFGT